MAYALQGREWGRRKGEKKGILNEPSPPHLELVLSAGNEEEEEEERTFNLIYYEKRSFDVS